MEIMVVLIAAIIITIVGVSVAASGKHKERREAGIASVLSRFQAGATVAQTRDKIEGILAGIPAVLHYTTRGSGSSATSWTELTLTPRPIPDFSLSLRPQTRAEERLAERGLAVDLVLGALDFDPKFIVEGAPADVVKHLLGPELRARLLALAPLELTADGTTFFLAKQGWLEDPATLDAFVVLAADFAKAIPTAIGDADARLAEQQTAGPAYRDNPDATAARAAKAQRKEEVAKLADVKRQRVEFLLTRATIVVVAVVGLSLVWLLVALAKRR